MAEKSGNNTAGGQRKRSGWRISHFRRGADRKWYFSGQQPGEVVRMVVRKHWCFMVRPALPAIASALVLILLLWMSTILPGDPLIWWALCGVAFLAFLVFAVMFASRDLVAWWFESFIITNKRIINTRGLFQPTRKEVSNDKIEQVGIGFNSLLGHVFHYGTVYVYLDGGELIMEDVPNPKRVRDALHDISEDVKAKKSGAPKKEQPMPEDPVMAAVLEELSKGKEVPSLENADADLPPPPGEGERFRGPRRTFGGILRIPAGVRYSSGEYTVKYIQRSRYVLWRNLAIPFLILLLVLPVAFLSPASGIITPSIQVYWWFIMGMLVVGCLVAMLLIYMNYVDDLYILTNKRIIDINRHFVLLFERRVETEYSKIVNLKVQVSNLLERFLDVGNLYIETPGNNPDIVLRTVDDPFSLMDEIQGIKGFKDRYDKAKKENEEKEKMKLWFGTMFRQLEARTRGRGAPDLREKDILTAIAYAQECGFDVSVLAEEPDPGMGVPPGFVLRQEPPAGTLMEEGSTIGLVLSASGKAATLSKP